MREWTLDIAGDPWVVRFVKPSQLPKDAAGLTRRDRKTILISNALSPTDEVMVLLHEIAHARLWDLDEEAVVELSLAQAIAVWRSINGVD